MATRGLTQDEARRFLHTILQSAFVTDDPAAKFDTLCRIHGVDVQEAFTLFHRLIDDADFKPTAAQSQLFEKLRHPTFLDLPPNVYLWQVAIDTARYIGVIGSNAIRTKWEDAFFMFHLMPMRARRDVLASVDLEALGKEPRPLSAAIRSSILVMQYGILPWNATRPPTDPLDIAGEIAKFPPPKGLPPEHAGAERAWRRRIYLDFNAYNARVLASFKDLKGAFSNDQIDHANEIAARLIAFAGQSNRPLSITPRDVFDNLFVRQPSGHDPILEAWSDKMADEEKDRRTLGAYWQERGQGNYHMALTGAVLEKLDALRPPIFTLPQLATEIGVSESELKRLLTNPRADQMWKREGDREEPTGNFKKLVDTLGIDNPEALIAPPERKLKAATEVTAVAVKVELPKTPWQAFGSERAEELFGSAYQTPQELIDKVLGFMNPPADQVDSARAVLTEALQNPSAYVDAHGNPSIAHLWLMWGLDPDTHKDFSPDTVFTGLEMTFQEGKDDRKLTEALYAPQAAGQTARHLTPQAALAWAAVKAAHSKQEGEGGIARVTSYTDFLRWAGMKEDNDDKVNHRWSALLELVDAVVLDKDGPQRPRAVGKTDPKRAVAAQLDGLVTKLFGATHKAQPYAGLYGSSTRAQAARTRLEPYLS